MLNSGKYPTINLCKRSSPQRSNRPIDNDEEDDDAAEGDEESEKENVRDIDRVRFSLGSFVSTRQSFPVKSELGRCRARFLSRFPRPLRRRRRLLRRCRLVCLIFGATI